MAKEAALNMEYFNENINGTKNINSEYKQTIEKEDHILLGESYLNYLFSNDYMKPFIRKNYEMKPDKKKSYFDKLNIFNYKDIFNDILNKKKKNFVTSESESIKKILNILDTNYELNNNHFNFKNRKNKINNIQTKYASYLKNIKENQRENSIITTYNNKKLHSSFEQYLLPKINIRRNEKKENKYSKDKYRNSLEILNDIFRKTSLNKPNDDNKNNNTNIDRFERYKKINFYSPLLKKNIHHIFRGMEDRENQSVKNSRHIKDGIGKISKTKFNIGSYDLEKNRYNIKYRNNRDKKYCLINLFSNIGKIKSPQEIEKTLFNQDENITFCKLKSNLEKKGIKRIKNNLQLILD